MTARPDPWDGLLHDETGAAARPLVVGSPYWTWGVALVADRLQPQIRPWANSPGLARQVTPSPAILPGFARLAIADDRAIAGFADRWGALWLCEAHQLPVGHDYSVCGPPSPLGESVDAWRGLAARAYRTLELWAALNRGERGNETSWIAFDGRSSDLTDNETLWDVDGSTLRGRLLAHGVQTMVDYASLRPRVDWRDGRAQFDVFGIAGGPELFRAIAIQLVQAVTRSAPLEFCSECGMPYAPRRRPRSGEQRYCESCGKQARWRQAQRRRRAKVNGGEA